MTRKNYTWDHLNSIQLLKYAEYYVKMELTRYGLDIYNAEVDKHEIDFSAKTSSSRFYDFHVQSVKNTNYISFLKKNFMPRNNLIAAIVIFVENDEPYLYFIPSTAWENLNELFVSRNNKDKQDNPEWGLNLSNDYFDQLMPYSPETFINTLK